MIARVSQTGVPLSQREGVLLDGIHQALDSKRGMSDQVKKILKADADYLMTGFKKGVKETIDFLRRESGYSLLSFREPRTFHRVDSRDYTKILEIRLDPNLNDQNEFEIIEAFINKSDDQEIRSFRAKIQIGPKQEHFAYIKELSIRYAGKEVLATEDDSMANQGQVPDLTHTLDLTPLDTQS